MLKLEIGKNKLHSRAERQKSKRVSADFRFSILNDDMFKSKTQNKYIIFINSSILPIDAGVGRSSSTKVGNDVRESFPNAISTNSMSDLESLDKISKLKAELDGYQKLLMTKLNSDNQQQQQQQIIAVRPNDMAARQPCSSERSLKSILNNQVSSKQ